MELANPLLEVYRCVRAQSGTTGHITKKRSSFTGNFTLFRDGPGLNVTPWNGMHFLMAMHRRGVSLISCVFAPSEVLRPRVRADHIHMQATSSPQPRPDLKPSRLQKTYVSGAYAVLSCTFMRDTKLSVLH